MKIIKKRKIMQTKGKMSTKEYECTNCGLIKRSSTNHYGEIYLHCKSCEELHPYKCNEPLPEGWGIPEPWKIVKLGDICEIKAL